MTARTRAPRRGDPARRILNTGGFTLIELLVAITIFTLVLVGVLGVLFHIQESWTTSSEAVTANTNERASVDLMANDIRMAGSGFGGLSPVTPGVPGSRVYPLQPRPGHNTPDTLFVTGALTGASTALSSRMQTASTDIVVTDITLFAINDLIVVSSATDANLFQVTGINAGTRTITHTAASAYNTANGHSPWPNGGYNIGARVVKVSRVAYWISEDGDTGEKTLMRQDFGSDPVAVANNVEWLRLRYIMVDGTISSSPADPAEIRSVLMDYVGPALADHASAADTLSMRIQPRVL